MCLVLSVAVSVKVPNTYLSSAFCTATWLENVYYLRSMLPLHVSNLEVYSSYVVCQSTASSALAICGLQCLLVSPLVTSLYTRLVGCLALQGAAACQSMALSVLSYLWAGMPACATTCILDWAGSVVKHSCHTSSRHISTADATPNLAAGPLLSQRHDLYR